jgi:EF hand
MASGFDVAAAKTRFLELTGGKDTMNKETYKKALFAEARIAASDAIGTAFGEALVLLVDTNNDKRISEEEYVRGSRFVQGALKDPEGALAREDLFDLLDSDKSGLLSVSELVKAVRLTAFGKMSEDKVEDFAKALMKEGDKSKDNKLNKEEWKAVVAAHFK